MRRVGVVLSVTFSYDIRMLLILSNQKVACVVVYLYSVLCYTCISIEYSVLCTTCISIDCLYIQTTRDIQ